MIRMTTVLLASLVVMNAPLATAKGLDALSENNPENAADAKDADKSDGDDEGDAQDHKDAKAEAAPMAKSASSKAIAGNLFLSTSFGWIKSSRSTGTWRSSGMSDVLIGYKVATLSPAMTVAGTYRYAPIGVSGELDSHSYRGIWEMHNLGGQANYTVTPSITALGSAELGFVSAHMHATDGLPGDDKAAAGGVSIGLGGGADYYIGEKSTSSIGPRLRVGFGSFTTVQVAGAFNVLF